MTTRTSPSWRAWLGVVCLAFCISVPMFAFADSPGLVEREAVSARTVEAGSVTGPIWDSRKHDIGELSVFVHNYGGLGFFEFPRGSFLQHAQEAKFVFGCVQNLDTLVSADYFHIFELTSFAEIRESSNRKNRREYDPDALAEQQFYAVFSDTMIQPNSGTDHTELRTHRPIGIEVGQTSYTWSESIAKRFVIVDWWIRNISKQTISRGVVGLRVHTAALFRTNYPFDLGEGDPSDWGNEITGFVDAVEGVVAGTLDTMSLSWSSDIAGEPQGNPPTFTTVSPRGVLGVRILRVPKGGRLSYNWWGRGGDTEFPSERDWGPRKRVSYTGYGGSLGGPGGDRGNYRMMTNGEVDYDQVYAAINREAEGWSPPPSVQGLARSLADGYQTEYLLSYGPLPDIPPGDSVPFTVAFVIGADFHRNPTNFQENFDYRDPRQYVNNLHFGDLIKNARWADWLFDNPGIDTDRDGDRGAAYLVNCDDSGCDSVFYRGDGVPDWRGPSAPPAPNYDLTSEPGRLILRWDGAYTEGSIDPFSLRRDFEGYRVYVGKFDRNDQLSLVTSWDVENFKRVTYKWGSAKWQQVSDPHTIRQWQQILGDDSFDPRAFGVPSLDLAYQDSVPDTLWNLNGEIVSIEWKDRLSYWEPEGPNRGNEYWEGNQWETNIVQRVGERDTVVDGTPLTFGIYEVTLDNLNQSIPLYCAVTAFDFGDYRREQEPLESSPASNTAYFEPIYSSDAVVDSGLKVGVFPNPYKSEYSDARGDRTTYYREGYEGRGVAEFSEEDRRIHFFNLPDTAVIRIYSLDGDLIRRIHHPDPFLTTYSSSVGWDLLSRNADVVISGIYIWKVDSRLGSQFGKLVIIK